MYAVYCGQGNVIRWFVSMTAAKSYCYNNRSLCYFYAHETEMED